MPAPEPPQPGERVGRGDDPVELFLVRARGALDTAVEFGGSRWQHTEDDAAAETTEVSLFDATAHDDGDDSDFDE